MDAAELPEFFAFDALLKATPAEEAGERILYIEASNEDVDHQNEVVLQKALADSAEYFLRHGNIDLSHYTLMGPKAGIPDYLTYEIGKPLAARVDGKSTFVKAQLYRGESPMAKNANMVWDSITRQTPPSRWYPSVGGTVLSKSVRIDPDTKAQVAVVDKVRWNNIALDRQPVNRTVPEVSLMPVGVFAKSLGGWVISKGLTAGYGTDSATLTGGAAMRIQDLDSIPKRTTSYHAMREQIAAAMRSGEAGKNPGARALVRFVTRRFSLDESAAAEVVERFMHDLDGALKRRRTAN